MGPRPLGAAARSPDRRGPRGLETRRQPRTVAYILTRPLGANLGDYFGSSHSDGGLGLGTFGTSVLFLSAILIVVSYLSVTRKDQTERARHSTD
jgi:hypothetical protein